MEGISIGGYVKDYFTGDTVKRFQAYGWQVIGGVDCHDCETIEQAIEKVKTYIEPTQNTIEDFAGRTP